MNLALKYRPDNFEDLIGQDVLVRILKNSFSLNKIPQSILLFGNSGVGKTTTARIIALCLNCSFGPTSNPCGSCKNCLAIKNSNHPDVIEIDAASHTSIEDIKIILENICYSSINSKFKIYIIDEVHMLSNNAFNALLKTLEEPPHNVKFILATTEIKKIPITIIARCQKFNLHNIPSIKIVKRLNDIAKKENYLIENGVSELIARHCNSSLRNALFLMDQVVLYSKGSTISIKNVIETLNIIDTDIVFNLLEIIVDGDLQNALLIFDKTVKSTDPLNIFEGLLQTIQLVCRYIITKEINISITDYEKDKIKNLSIKKSLIFYSRLWKVLLNGIHDIKISTCNDVAAEMILINLCYLSDLPSLEKVIKKVFIQNTQHIQKNVCNIKSNKEQKNYNFDKILQLLQQDKQIYLYKQLCNNLQLVDCKNGYLKLKAMSQLNNDFCSKLKNYLNHVTQLKWIITIDQVCTKEMDSSNAPIINDILNTFKGAKVINVEDNEN
ncbi:MAG: DNA polymerase III subunit gamma/tau [Wolbachia endosymbiont of Menacanthus eurysternus]|nr:MAG: DNA polymerase III subunit gamma/tau [Wolbachia endosymbiont of Menacanthus eurysternus]